MLIKRTERQARRNSLQLALADRNGGGERDLDREARAASDRRADGNVVLEHAGNALHDREAEPQATRNLGALVETVKLLKNRAFLGARDAKPGVVDVDAQSPR